MDTNDRQLKKSHTFYRRINRVWEFGQCYFLISTRTIMNYEINVLITILILRRKKKTSCRSQKYKRKNKKTPLHILHTGTWFQNVIPFHKCSFTHTLIKVRGNNIAIIHQIKKTLFTRLETCLRMLRHIFKKRAYDFLSN